MKPIWIVDDDHSIRFVLEKALTREQFQVRSFASAREVLAALDDDAPQVMVSDIRMPGGSGIDLLAKVKELEQQLNLERACRDLERTSRLHPKERRVVFVATTYFGDNVKYAWLGFRAQAKAWHAVSEEAYFATRG